MGGVDLAGVCVPCPEALGPAVRQFINLDKTELAAVAAEAGDPFEVQLSAAGADAAIATPRPQDHLGSWRALEACRAGPNDHADGIRRPRSIGWEGSLNVSAICRVPRRTAAS